MNVISGSIESGYQGDPIQHHQGQIGGDAHPEQVGAMQEGGPVNGGDGLPTIVAGTEAGLTMAVHEHQGSLADLESSVGEMAAHWGSVITSARESKDKFDETLRNIAIRRVAREGELDLATDEVSTEDEVLGTTVAASATAQYEYVQPLDDLSMKLETLRNIDPNSNEQRTIAEIADAIALIAITLATGVRLSEADLDNFRLIARKGVEKPRATMYEEPVTMADRAVVSAEASQANIWQQNVLEAKNTVRDDAARRVELISDEELRTSKSARAASEELNKKEAIVRRMIIAQQGGRLRLSLRRFGAYLGLTTNDESTAIRPSQTSEAESRG